MNVVLNLTGTINFVLNAAPKFLIQKTSNPTKVLNTKNTVDEGKHLNPKVIYGIIGGGVLVIAFILFTSGTFDSAPVTNIPVNQNQQQNNVSSGVNLNNIQMINDLEAKDKTKPGRFE